MPPRRRGAPSMDPVDIERRIWFHEMQLELRGKSSDISNINDMKHSDIDHGGSKSVDDNLQIPTHGSIITKDETNKPKHSSSPSNDQTESPNLTMRKYKSFALSVGDESEGINSFILLEHS